MGRCDIEEYGVIWEYSVRCNIQTVDKGVVKMVFLGPLYQPEMENVLLQKLLMVCLMHLTNIKWIFCKDYISMVEISVLLMFCLWGRGLIGIANWYYRTESGRRIFVRDMKWDVSICRLSSSGCE